MLTYITCKFVEENEGGLDSVIRDIQRDIMCLILSKSRDHCLIWWERLCLILSKSWDHCLIWWDNRKDCWFVQFPRKNKYCFSNSWLSKVLEIGSNMFQT